MKTVALIALTLSLSACTMMSPAGTYTLNKQPAGASLSSSGTVNVKNAGGTVTTTASISGLAPNTYYVAHYHTQGTASSNPCESNGAAIMSSKILAQTDTTGMLKLSGTVSSSEVMNATYFNVHTAKDESGVPADAGVLCTTVKLK